MPPAKITMRPFSRCRIARRRMNGSATWFISIADLHARVHALLFQRILQRQRIDHRRQHAHVIGGDPVHVLGLLRYAAEKVSSAHHDRQLHAQLVNVGQFGGNFVDASRLHAKALIGRQRLT